MDDEADVEKMIEVLRSSKKEQTDQFEYEGFINYDDSDIEDVEECPDEDYADDLEELQSADNFTTLDLSNLYKYNPISSLKPEEKQIIESCADPELKKILLLNRQKNMQLIQLYKKIKDTLIECKQNIVEKNEIIKQCSEVNKGAKFSAGIWRLGAPYFKDRQLYYSPSNEDALTKRKNQELSVYDINPTIKWTSHECDMLMRAIKVNYNINQQNEVRRRIKEVASTGGEEEELAELTARLDELDTNDNSEIPPLNSDTNIDWSRVAEVFNKDRHSAFECRSVWHIHLHPSLNKGPWTAEENEKLRKLVVKYRCQRWDTIAEELGSSRSCFAACNHYFSKLQRKFKRGEFTYAEDRKLLEVINKYRMGSFIPWVKVVKHFKNRTRSQLHHRYTYYLSQHHKKLGKFSEAEDVLIMICVDKFGRNFRKCTEYLPKRSLIQIKARYSSNLRNFVKKGTWSVEEDKMIMEHVESRGSSNWTELAEKMTRSRGQLRQRYKVVTAFLEQNPDATIDDVKRRKHGWSKEQEEYMSLRLLADEYKNKPFIPTVKDIEKHLKLIKRNGCSIPKKELLTEDEDSDSEDGDDDFDVPETGNVDDLLTNFFSNIYKVGAEPKPTPTSLEAAVDDVEVLMDVLKVDLDIPEDLRGFGRLDAIDLDILTALRRRRPEGGPRSANVHVRELVPPNLHSTVGMRSLLIKNLHFRGSSKERIFGKFDMFPRSSVSRIRFDITQGMGDMGPEEGALVEADRALFYRRFYSLFKWPSLMTLEGPSPELRNVTENIREDVRPPVKRTYSRLNRTVRSDDTPEGKKPKLPDDLQPPDDTPEGKKPKLPDDLQPPDDTPEGKKPKLPDLLPPPPPVVQPGSSAPPLKLTPVTNKSVIENLMKDKNKKLFYFNEVQCGKETKTVIKEVKLNMMASATRAQKSARHIKKRPIAKSSSTGTSNELGRSYTTKNNYIGAKSGQKLISETTPNIPPLQNISRTEVGHENNIYSMEERRTDTSPFSVSEDGADPTKLNAVSMGGAQAKTEVDADSDLYDLQRLNIFLKGELEENEDSDSASEMSFTL